MSSGKKQLSTVEAIWGSLFHGSNISFFPRLKSGDGSAVSNVTAEIIRQINTELESVKIGNNGKNLDCVIERASATLDDVKALTEYQDQKASRLLTVITFFSALAGALFTHFTSTYPLRAYLFGLRPNWRAILVVCCYGSFAAFVLCALCGAIVIFQSTRTRFKWPTTRLGDDSGRTIRAKSRLFFDGILSVTPATWAREFISEECGDRILMNELELKWAYARNYILESYLVAAKVADKLRYMSPGQDLLFYSLKALLLWLLLFAAVSMMIPS